MRFLHYWYRRSGVIEKYKALFYLQKEIGQVLESEHEGQAFTGSEI